MGWPAADQDSSASSRWGIAALASAVFVVVAIVAEVLAGANANSAVSGWELWIPLAWPQAARVLWWLAVAGAAGTFRLALHRLGFRQRAAIVVASVGPFVAFAIGISFGADWSTWH